MFTLLLFLGYASSMRYSIHTAQMLWNESDVTEVLNISSSLNFSEDIKNFAELSSLQLKPEASFESTETWKQSKPLVKLAILGSNQASAFEGHRQGASSRNESAEEHVVAPTSPSVGLSTTTIERDRSIALLAEDSVIDSNPIRLAGNLKAQTSFAQLLANAPKTGFSVGFLAMAGVICVLCVITCAMVGAHPLARAPDLGDEASSESDCPSTPKVQSSSPRQKFRKMLAKGKERRGADAHSEYRFGDVTRGIIGGRRIGNVKKSVADKIAGSRHSITDA